MHTRSKRRILSVLLSLAMVLSIMGGLSVFALPSPATTVSLGNSTIVLGASSGDVIFTGTYNGTGPAIKVGVGYSGTIGLSGVTINATAGNGIEIDGAANIELAGTNTVTASAAAIRSDGNLSIADGTLNASGATAINTDGRLTVAANVTAEGVGTGIRAANGLTINSGKVSAKATSGYGIVWNDGATNAVNGGTVESIGSIHNYAKYNTSTNTYIPMQDLLNAIPESEYTLTVVASPAAGGKAVISNGATPTNTYKKGAIVTLTATAAEGYKFTGWTASNGGTFSNPTSPTPTFTMPDSNTTITANFDKISITPDPEYRLTVNATEGGTAKIVNPASSTGTYKKGTLITITATPDKGYEFVKWVSGNGTFVSVTNPTTNFTMPDSAATITAEFKKVGTVVPVPEYQLTVKSNYGGTAALQGGATTGSYKAGDTVQISATASNYNYEFTYWTSDNGGAFGSTNASTTTFTMPEGDVTVTAGFRYTGSTGGSRGGGGGGGSSSADGGTSTVVTNVTAAASSNVGSNGVVSSTAITNEVTKALSSATGTTAIVNTRNATSITAATLKAMANTASSTGKTVVLHADTMTADGRGVQGRLYVAPDKLSNSNSDLKLGVYTALNKTASVKALFERYFDNKVAVISMDQQGALGARLEVAAKVDLSSLNTENLVFYSYNRATNNFVQISNTAYFIDANGFLHFYTEQAGDIIITDKALVKK